MKISIKFRKRDFFYALCVLTLLLIGGFIYLYTIPLNLYSDILSRGANYSFLNLQPPHQSILKTLKFNESSWKDHKENDKFYRDIHFQNFKLSLPVRHPLVTLKPFIVEDVEKGVTFGVDYYSGDGRKIFSFKVEKKRPLDLKLNSDKFFKLPLVKMKIEQFSDEQIFKDLFLYNVNWYSGNSWKIPFLFYKRGLLYLEDISYAIYILKLRQLVFPENLKSLRYIESRKFGISEIASDSKRWKEEKLYFNLGKDEQIISIQTHQFDSQALKLRKRFLQQIELKRSQRLDSAKLYAEYKKLRYSERASLYGIFYLYAAWTHEIENLAFLKEFILFSKKAKVKTFVTSSVFDYLFKKDGINFIQSFNLNSNSVDSLKSSFKKNNIHKKVKTKKELLEFIKEKKINIDNKETVLILE